MTMTDTAQPQEPGKSKAGRPLYNPRPHAYLDLLGMQRVVPEPGWDSQTELVIDARLANPGGGTAHGGAIFSLMDTCMAGALRRKLDPDEFPSTIESKINYIKAAKIGTVLLCSSRVVTKGRRVCVLQGEIRDDQGDLVAMATATFTPVKIKPAT
jgi:acyl-CoA thioesterase